MTQMQSYLTGIIEEITEAKEGAVEPCAAHIDEIFTAIRVEVSDALRWLCRSGAVVYSLDINKKPMFKLNRPRQ